MGIRWGAHKQNNLKTYFHLNPVLNMFCNRIGKIRLTPASTKRINFIFSGRCGEAWLYEEWIVYISVWIGVNKNRGKWYFSAILYELILKLKILYILIFYVFLAWLHVSFYSGVQDIHCCLASRTNGQAEKKNRLIYSNRTNLILLHPHSKLYLCEPWPNKSQQTVINETAITMTRSSAHLDLNMPAPRTFG